MADATDSFATSILDNASDYGDFGSDAEEAEIIDLLLAQASSEGQKELPPSFRVTDIEDYEPPEGIRLPSKNDGQARQHPAQLQIETEGEAIFNETEITRVDAKRRASLQQRETTPPETIEPDDRSPLEKFRKPPKKALSVTDLVSPAWCELQYFYTLSKHGRKRRTPAMKQGSAVHQALEDEVHTTVTVETTKIEDSWGLRLWNICQGLQTLRETGRTREFEIWGTIGGELVNGIIDELSYDCPDPKHQEALTKKGVPVAELPEYQTSITEYLLARPDHANGQSKNNISSRNEKWIYITDVKTRATPTLPTGSSIRPTIVQLHLYHHMLENLAQDNFDLQILADRYGLDIDEVFSDSFLAQLANLDQHVFSDSSPGFTEDEILTGTSCSSQDSMSLLIRYNTLRSLWDHMRSQFKKTFLLDEKMLRLPLAQDMIPPASQQSTSDLPPPPSQPTRLSPLLTATYLSANYKHSPSKSTGPVILGRKSFDFDPAFLYEYLTDSLSWWRGEREAKGVALQEAWKCRSCDFRNDCSWIVERDQAAFDEAMQRRKMRDMAEVEMKGEESRGDNASRSVV